MNGKRYTVCDNRTESVLCISVPAYRAAKCMGISTVGSFYSTVSRCKKGNNKKWFVEVEK